MNKFLLALSFCISTILFSNYSEAAHCSGGHKEIKETSDETSETTKKPNQTKLKGSLLLPFSQYDCSKLFIRKIKTR